MRTDHGFVYVLRNESMPSVYKIGYTMGHPKVRMDELSGATACPTPFTLLACFGTRAPREVEAALHVSLRAYRINMSREFFRVDLGTLADEIYPHIDPCDDMNNLVHLHALHRVSERKAAQEWKREYFLSQCADPIVWPEKFWGFD